MLESADLDYADGFGRARNPQHVSDTGANSGSFSVFGMASNNVNRGMVASSSNSEQGSEGYNMHSMAWT